MTLARCKARFTEMLNDPENRVIALSGKWGTGKSHLWREVQAASTDDTVRKAPVVSLFGVNSIAILQLKLAQQVLLQSKDKRWGQGTLTQAAAGLTKALSSWFAPLSALEHALQMLLPQLLRGRFLVIDDIERKHADLGVDEVLGFIDDCVQNLGCSVLLILNTDELGENTPLWELFREKVIDQEVRLDTTASEAFDIAARQTPTVFEQHIKQAVEICQVTNIRIIRKIIRVVNALLPRGRNLPEGALARAIPSTTLLCAIHYKGMEDGPDFEFVLGFADAFAEAIRRAGRKQQPAEEMTDSERARERWHILMDRLGIRGVDEFEALVADYLRSGLLDSTFVTKIIERYAAEEDQLAARNRAQDFYDRCVWFPDMDDAVLVEEARGILQWVHLLDAATVTTLARLTSELDEGTMVSEELVSAWIEAYRARSAADTTNAPTATQRRRLQSLHPRIAEVIAVELAAQHSPATVLDVCRSVSNGGWGEHENAVMRTITAPQYEAAIVEASGEDLRLILLQSMEFLKNKGNYESFFGSGIAMFLEACRSLARQGTHPKRQRLIRRLFEDAKMLHLLEDATAHQDGDSMVVNPPS